MFPQIDDLTQKLSESDSKCGKLAETCRDKDLKLDLLQSEVSCNHNVSEIINPSRLSALVPFVASSVRQSVNYLPSDYLRGSFKKHQLFSNV